MKIMELDQVLLRCVDSISSDILISDIRRVQERPCLGAEI